MKNIKRIKKLFTYFFLLILLSGLVLLVLEFRDVIKEAINTGSWEPITDKFESYGFWGIFFVSLTQTMAILLTFIPGTPIQIIAAISLGQVWGFVACLIGIFLGNLTIFILSRKIGSNSEVFYENKNLSELERVARERGLRFFSWFVIFLYLIPVFPYGLIAFAAAKAKMRYPRYFLITTLGAVPSTALNIFLGKMITGTDYKTTLIVIAIFILLTILVVRYHQRFINYLTNRPIKNMTYFQGKVRKPGTFLYYMVYFVLKLFLFPKVKAKARLNDVDKIEPPYLLIYNHPSKFDFAYALLPLFPKKINSIIAYYYFCNYRLGRLLHHMGGFPKFLYHPDVSSIKNIKRVIRDKGILGIAPEGRLSAYGCMESLAPATEKLVKHLGVPVVMAKINGAYLTFPKWSKKVRRGRVEIEYEQILTAEEIKQMSAEEIKQVLNEKLYYDDFKWQEEKKIYYKGKNLAEGLEHLLYICPVCKEEFTFSAKGNDLTCSSCGVHVHLNNYYEFEADNPLIPKNIRDWYLYQKAVEKKNVERVNYLLESRVTLKFPDPAGKGFTKVGEGVTVMTEKGVTYTGTINGELKTVYFKIENIPAILFGINEDFEIYHDNTLYYFIPENIRECVKWSVVGEAMYNKYLEKVRVVEE
ncbi:MAG: VTT domain-containing protein [Bacilli bacterium]